jgi:uncharacterized protein (DUF1330 family)
MAAYVLTSIEVTDPEGYEGYKKLSGPSIEKYGGRFLVRGGKVETIEGEWDLKRFVIAEFESMEQAHKWYNSPEYAEAKAIRLGTSTANMVFVEGL